ncbi:PIN domain-like protein, partial [Meira miltonrushii]
MKHAIAGKEFLLLRTIFYRLCKLAALPYLVPVFVFDGFSRPALKRGKKTPFTRTPSGRNLFGKLEIQVKQLVEAFGFVLLQAPGEAEADLSDLNRRGLIDAILSDDSDCFLFGAKTVVRNWDKAKQGDYVFVYRVDDFAKGLDAASCVLLIGLLGGGDYDVSGVRQLGIRTAIGLSKCGFDDRLLKAPPRIKSEGKWQEFLQEWKDDMKKELRTNASGNLSRKQSKLANS